MHTRSGFVEDSSHQTFSPCLYFCAVYIRGIIGHFDGKIRFWFVPFGFMYGFSVKFTFLVTLVLTLRHTSSAFYRDYKLP